MADPTGDADPFPWEGEVTGTNVYVRSGAGVNWYPTTKLNTGDRVLVLEEESGWYKIVPPRNMFSYIDVSRAERQPGRNVGTVTQNDVGVRAGSLLSNRKSATQMCLNKGAKVDIIGEVDGFYKIVPPHGAGLFISKRYVTQVPERLRTGLLERYTSAAPKPQQPAKKPDKQKDARKLAAIKPKVDKPKTTPITRAPDALAEDDGPPLEVAPTIKDLQKPVAATDTKLAEKPHETKPAAEEPTLQSAEQPRYGRYEVMLTELESLLHAELRRPLLEQNLSPLRLRYQEIAEQEDEHVPAAIAQIRVRQLRDREELLAKRAEHLEAAEDLASFRSGLDEERMKIMRRRVDAAMDKFDLEGELRKSHVFAPEKRRYRLVDIEQGTIIAYVDIPATLEVDVKPLIGRPVGVHTSGQRYSPSAHVPIAVASSIIDLTPAMPLRKPALSHTGGNTTAPIAKSTTEEPEASTDEAAEPAEPKVAAGGEGAESAQ
jgi:hypothetical protein